LAQVRGHCSSLSLLLFCPLAPGLAPKMLRAPPAELPRFADELPHVRTPGPSPSTPPVRPRSSSRSSPSPLTPAAKRRRRMLRLATSLAPTSATAQSSSCSSPLRDLDQISVKLDLVLKLLEDGPLGSPLSASSSPGRPSSASFGRPLRADAPEFVPSFGVNRYDLQDVYVDELFVPSADTHAYSDELFDCGTWPSPAPPPEEPLVPPLGVPLRLPGSEDQARDLPPPSSSFVSAAEEIRILRDVIAGLQSELFDQFGAMDSYLRVQRTEMGMPFHDAPASEFDQPSASSPSDPGPLALFKAELQECLRSAQSEAASKAQEAYAMNPGSQEIGWLEDQFYYILSDIQLMAGDSSAEQSACI